VAGSRHCAACGRGNDADARFCSGCGSPLTAEAPQREARKVITALFADVVGSTALGERLDAEDLQAVVGEAVARLVRVAEELGGHVDRVVGDGALVLFGAPVAHEDDAERAVLAGLRIVEAIRDYATEVEETWGIEDFAVRVGVETGVAVLAPLGGARPIEFGAAGDVLNTAARLEAAAAPQSALVGPRAFRQTEASFVWEPPIELELKGKADVVVAHRPRRAGAPGGRRLDAARRAPLTGRKPELELLGSALDELLSGTGGVLVVSGDPGLGKTRLLAELRARMDRSTSPGGRPVWLEGRCVSYGERLPYLPFQVLLREWLGIGPEQTETEAGALLDERLRALCGERAEELRTFLAPLVGIAPRAGDAAQLAGLGPDDLQRRTAAALTELIERLAQAGPVVLAFDDLHWADASSVGLIERLLPVADDAPVLVLLASRPERGHRSWALREAAVRELGHRTRILELDALARDADRDLLASLVGGAELPPELERRVLDSAEGNPLYIEELVRALIDAGALVPEDGGWRFERAVEVEVPATVENLILARVDVLSPVARELLNAASVLGRRFSGTLLEAVAGDASAVRELIRAELVHEGGRWPEQEYRFKHHLIQEATYGSLLKRRRAELHRRAAEALELSFADRIDEQLALLAHHWGAAGEHERTLSYHARAAARARRIGAWREGLDHYDAALAAATELGLDERDQGTRHLLLERGRLRRYSGLTPGFEDLDAALAGARAAGDRGTEVEALVLLAWWRHGGYANAVALAEEALAIARALEDERAQVSALARLTILDANRLRLDRAVAEGREALEIARRRDDEQLLVWGLDGLKLAELKLGDLGALEEHCAELIELNERGDDRFYLQFSLLESAFAPLGAGRFDEALARVERAKALNGRLGDRANEPLFFEAECWVHRAAGHYSRALEAGRAAHRRLEESGLRLPEWHAWIAATLGWVLLDLRAADEAIPLLTAGAAAAREAGATGEVLRCSALLAWARWLKGERGDALGVAEVDAMLAEVTVPPGGAWLYGAHAQLALARTHAACGEPDSAEGIAGPIREAARGTGWREAAAAAALVLGLCEEARGRAAAGIELFREAREAPGAPACAWEADLGLARLLDGADGDRHAAEARGAIERVLASLGADPAAATLADVLATAASRP
jgi:class 3 adenylate cyclase